ncbi:hypothetical protein, partial [Escherichia coli]|uniref:hypothetical protein n=1 Tax=Escherichia coli TaxID=562 RepID=UPI001BC83A7D
MAQGRRGGGEGTPSGRDWLQSAEVRRRADGGRDKGVASKAQAEGVFYSRLGEVRDGSFEQQSYRASELRAS